MKVELTEKDIRKIAEHLAKVNYWYEYADADDFQMWIKDWINIHKTLQNNYNVKEKEKG